MADIAGQVEVDDSHNGVYVIENTRFTSISQELNGTVVILNLLFDLIVKLRIRASREAQALESGRR